MLIFFPERQKIVVLFCRE